MKTAGNVLVDTNIVVAYFRGEKDLHDRFTGEIPVCVPWVVPCELYFGAQRARWRQEQLDYIGDHLTYADVLFGDREATSGSRRWPGSIGCHWRPGMDTSTTSRN